MHRWLLDVFRVLDGRGPVFDIPGWSYAKALALRAVKDEEGATKALEEAVREWPSVVPLLADKCDIGLSGGVRGHRAFRIFTRDMYVSFFSISRSLVRCLLMMDGFRFSEEDESLLHLLSHLYVQRSSPLWKDPSISSWFATTVESVTASNKLPPTPTDTKSFARLSAREGTDFAHGVYRHVVVLGTPAQRLLSYIPQSLLRENFTCDPLPPPHASTKYDESFFANSEDPFSLTTTPRSTAAQNRMLERVVPDGELRRQLQELFEGNEALRGQFPGGVVQFAQVVGGLDEDALQDLMVGAIGGGRGRGEDGEGGEEAHERGRMPGGMPGEEGLVFLQFGDGEGEGEGGEEVPGLVDAAPVEPVLHAVEDEGDEEYEEEEEEEEEEDVAVSPTPHPHIFPSDLLTDSLGSYSPRPSVLCVTSSADSGAADALRSLRVLKMKMRRKSQGGPLEMTMLIRPGGVAVW